MATAIVSINPSREEWDKMLEEISKPRPPQKIHIPPAFMLALNDEDFIRAWNQGNEKEYFLIDQPVGLETSRKITDRAKKLNLQTQNK